MSDVLLKDLILRIEKLSKQLDELKNDSLRNDLSGDKDFSNRYYDSAQMRDLFHLSNSKLQSLRNQEKLPFIKLGRKYLYPADMINSMFNN